MTKLLVVAVPFLFLPASPAVAATGMPEPPGVLSVEVGGHALSVWPYSFQEPAAPGEPSDPVNLVFLNSDPREIRQILLALEGSRPAFPVQMGRDCRWADAMGNEQASWADGGWVGSEVQLVCTDEGLPLGNPFRVHLRLFRHGALTLGAAHYEVQIPGTAEHEALSWDFARTFVTLDVIRAGVLTAPPSAVPLIAPGTFRVVRRPVWEGLYKGGAPDGAGPILKALGLFPAPADKNAPVPIPTSGVAVVLVPAIQLAPEQAERDYAYDVNYDVVSPKPFCNGPADYVRLLGPVHFRMRVHTNPSGKYERTYEVTGTLTVIPLTWTPGGWIVGQPLTAEVSEYHRAMLTDNYGQVREQVSRTLLGEVPQSMSTVMNAGQIDEFSATVTCEAP